MADISAEITAFKNAAYGEDVRSAMVSLANKVNNESGTAADTVRTYNTRLTNLENDKSTYDTRLTNLENDENAASNNVKTIIFDSYYNVNELNTYGSALVGKKILNDGSTGTDNNYSIVKYPVSTNRGCLLKVISEYNFAFYTTSNAYSSTLIGTVYGPGEYFVVVPDTASMLMMSVFVNESTAKVYLAESKKIGSADINNGAIINPKIKDKTISFDKTNFINIQPEANLFNEELNSDRQNTWYYVGSSINKISLTPITVNGYWGLFAKISDEFEKISYNFISPLVTFYNYYFVDENENILARGGNGDALNRTGTLDIPSGSKYILMSIRIASWNKLLMLCYGTDASVYTPYTEDFFINGNKLAKKTYVDEEISHLQEEIDTFSPTYDCLRLPNKIDISAGRNWELFFKGICNCVDSNQYEFDILVNPSITNMKNWARKFTASPSISDVGIHEMTVTMRDNRGNIIDTGTTNIVVNSIPSSPENETVILCMGDSLSTSGGWIKELRRMLIDSGGTPAGLELNNINFIGTKELSDGTRYEGYGGWTFTSYSTANKSNAYMWIDCQHDKTDAGDQHSFYQDSNGQSWKLETIETNKIKIIRQTGTNSLPATGTLTWINGGQHHSDITYTNSEQASGNPYWSETLNRNDFRTYAAQFNVNHIDHCIILLGWNSTGTNETYYKGIVRTFLDSLLDSTYGFPNCKITLVGLQVPSRDGMGENFAPGWYFYSKLQHVWNLQKWYQELLSEYNTADYVDLSSQFDTEYNCITSQLDVNLRNSTKVTIQTNAIHPGPSGYLEISDAIFGNLISRL